jgi:hypothetical protein
MLPDIAAVGDWPNEGAGAGPVVDVRTAIPV